MRNKINQILLPYSSEPDVFVLLDICVGRILRRSGDVSIVDKGGLRHIADWLRAALVNDEPWLKNVDERGRPKKLMKFGSIDAIIREADKAMLKTSQKLRSVKLVNDDEALYAEIGDGFYLVRLLTPAALDRESAEMQHCIGNGGYDDYLNDGRHLYLSLRDPQGKAHVTMEIEDGDIIQLQGKQNDPPIPKYLDILVPYIRASGLKVDVPPSHLGYVIDIDGIWHPLDKLPEGIKVDSYLQLRDANIAALPKNLTVVGFLDLYNTNIEALSEGLSVQTSIYLTKTRIAVLPEGLSVGGDLYLDHTPIVELPEGLTVIGNLVLNKSPITALPKGLTVGKNLHLSSTKIVELPEDLSVKGDLYLDDTPIAVLPKGLSVGGDLNLSNTIITALPVDLSVGESLYMNNTKILALSEGLKVGKGLYLSNTPIASLPEDLTVRGDLYLENAPISTLPNGLNVGGDLVLNNTNISALPDDISIGGNIRLHDTQITALPDNINNDTIIYYGHRKMTAKEYRAMMMPKKTSISEKQMNANFGA